MSLSFRKLGVTAAAGVAAGLGTSAGAAEVYYQPVVTLGSGYNTNIDLEPQNRQSAVGYFADAATNIGIATPTSDTVLQPRLLYNYYPSVTRRNRLEGFLNLSTRVGWQRDRFSMAGVFDHRDDVNAEQVVAENNNPGVGDNSPDTGRTVVGTIRNYLILDPTYSHLLTPLSSIGFAGEYQGMRYSPSAAGHIDFNFYQGRLFYAKTIDLRNDITIGAFGSRYQANTVDAHTTSEGVQLSGGHSWTQVLKSDLTVAWQHSQFEETGTKIISTRANPWSAYFGTTYTEQVSSYRITVGRSIYPSSAGVLFTIDQIRGQYDRELTQRLHFTGAIRFFHDRNTTGGSGNDPRNYATTTVRLEYKLTPTIFVAGNYTYIYQKYRTDPTAAEANVALLQFGYRGLERQR